MASIFKITVVQYWLHNAWLDPEGKPCAKDAPGARFVKARKVSKGTPGAMKERKKSKKWYGRVPGSRKPIPLSANKVAAGQMLANRIKNAELGKAGICDPFEAHRRRPLSEHITEWEVDLRAVGAGAKHVRAVVACVRRIFSGCKFTYSDDLSGSQVTAFLASLREGQRLPPLEEKKETFTKKEVALALGVKLGAIPPLLKRHRLEATGNGKARRYPRATVEFLRATKARGFSVKTTNLYLDAVKQFAAWMVKDRRMAENPLAHLSGGDVRSDRRHDRRVLALDEVRTLIRVANASTWTFRGLTGRDRAVLYSTACATGFRAEELSSLLPHAFDLYAPIPLVTLSARHAKNGETATQPLPPEVAELLASYLRDKPANEVVWPGTWFEKAAEMMRSDLEVAGIPYCVEGPDGPLYADFHALRHSYIRLLDHSGASLRETMQLARHSDPKLTMRVYGRARLHDLGEAVRRLPSLFAEATLPAAQQDKAATG